MANDVVINGTTYPAVESIAMRDANGNVTMFYPDAVRYVEQELTPEQKARARANIGAISDIDIPQKGVDYWTPTDQESIVQDVIKALGTPVFGRVDAENNIILTGELAEGTYTIKYEDAEGNQTTIGTLSADGETELPTYNNVLPLAIAADGTPFNGGMGYKAGYRLNSSGAETAEAGMKVTGFIPVKADDMLYFKDIEFYNDSSAANKCYVWTYDTSFTPLGMFRDSNLTQDYDWAKNEGSLIVDANNHLVGIKLVAGLTASVENSKNIKYVRISAWVMSDESVITINEPIE